MIRPNDADWLSVWMDYTKDMEADAEFRWWAGVFCLSATVRRLIYFPFATHNWYPNLYLVLVAPPAICKKSTIINTAKALLLGIKDELQLSVCPANITWQSFVEHLSKTKQTQEEVRGVNPTTGEVSLLFDKLTYCHSTIFADEMSVFFKPDDAGLRDVLTSLWDCPSGIWEKHTKGSGKDKVNSPCINLVAGTTPEHLLSYPSAFAQGGLASRCVFIYQEKRCKRVAYPPPPTTESTQLRSWLRWKLRQFAKLRGILTIHDDAKSKGEDWYNQHCDALDAGEVKASAWQARKQMLIHKVAMLMSVSRGTEGHINLATLESAIDRVERIQEHIERAVRLIESSHESYIMNEMLLLLKKKKECSWGELVNAVMHYERGGAVKRALELLASNTQLVEKVLKQGKDWGLQLLADPKDPARQSSPVGSVKGVRDPLPDSS